MGTSKCNGLGCFDAKKIIKQLKVVYPTGYMEINLDVFFPCALNKVKKVFSLIHQYSSEFDKDELVRYFRERENVYYLEMALYAEKVSSYHIKSIEYRDYMSRFKEASRLLQRIKRNREIFEMGRVYR